MNINKENLSFLNQLASEVILLDKNLRFIWLNDSALNKGWVLNKNNDNNYITDQFSEETNGALISLLKKTIEQNGTKTKRDFELITSVSTKRVIDITVSWSNEFECLILEILCVDNNKQLQKYVGKKFPKLKAIVIWEEVADPKLIKQISVPVYQWKDFLELGSSVSDINPNPKKRSYNLN